MCYANNTDRYSGTTEAYHTADYVRTFAHENTISSTQEGISLHISTREPHLDTTSSAASFTEPSLDASSSADPVTGITTSLQTTHTYDVTTAVVTSSLTGDDPQQGKQ